MNKHQHIHIYIQLIYYYIYPNQPIEKEQGMTTGTSSQSQPSYLHYTVDQKPNYEAVLQTQPLDEHAATLEMNRVTAAMTVQEGQRFEQSLHGLSVLFHKGYSHLFITHNLLMRKMMNHFTKLGKQLQDDSDNSKIQSKMLHILSLIAELLRNNPKFYYPFTRKFLLTVFLIDSQLISKSSMKPQILAILSMLFQNLSRQPKLVTKYALQNNLKQAVLQSYHLIEQVFTLKAMNKTIQNLSTKGITFSVAEFHKYQVEQTVSRIIAKNQMEMFLVKMRMVMLGGTTPKDKGQDQGTGSGIHGDQGLCKNQGAAME